MRFTKTDLYCMLFRSDGSSGKRFGFIKGKCIKIPRQFIPYFHVQAGILVQLLSASSCGSCKVQEIWDSICVMSDCK